jgi:hypothetical protein
MAYNPAPSAWIPSWSENGTTISVPIASFPELTATEADGTTGDIRKVYFALCSQMYDKYLATAADSKPVRMSFQKNVTVNTTTNVSTVYFTCIFDCTISGIDVANEP